MEKLSFDLLARVVEDKFNEMVSNENGVLVRSDIENDVLWNTYLESFPTEVNGIFRERRVYDCTCCRSFITRVGGALLLDGDTITSVWDVTVPGYFQLVADAMSRLVKSGSMDTLFASVESVAGSKPNRDTHDDITWDHFYTRIPSKFVLHKDKIGSYVGASKTNFETLDRSLSSLSIDSMSTVLDLLEEGALYRSTQFLPRVKQFVALKHEYDQCDNKTFLLWKHSIALKGESNFRGSVIGTLITDINDGVDLERAVASFENKVSGVNYKRTSALVTPAMIKKAKQTIDEHGLMPILSRRFATKQDINVNDTLFIAEKEKSLDIFDDLMKESNSKGKVTKSIAKIDLNTFINDVLPTSKKVELLFDRVKKSNLVTILTGDDVGAFKWDNPFTWAYNGDTTDRIIERVKAAGGKVDGDVRVSLAWHNADDLDLHCYEPSGQHIYYSNRTGRSGVKLDVDMNGMDEHDSENPVENMVWENKSDMMDGEYRIMVHNYNKRANENVGFTLQVSIDGVLSEFTYDNAVHNREEINAFVLDVNNGNVSIKKVSSLLTTNSINGKGESVWGMETNTFVDVSTIMWSPNYWGENGIGNKHLMFMVDGARTDDQIRTFYNEYMKSEFNEIRKAIELIGTRSKVLGADYQEQLCGFGFADTIKDTVVLRINGNRMYEVSIN